jgi:Transposase and inactivated derivatives
MIREKALDGKSAYAIGKELGISKNTARKYITRNEDSPPKIDRFSKLNVYKPLLHEFMNQGIFNCVVLLERLRDAGYSGGISIVKEYVHPYRPAKALPAVRRYETPAGKQAQMDWGICHYTDSNGTFHKVPVFVMILGKSRVKYAEFTSRCDLSSLQRCIVNAFLYFGGMPKEVLTDNMKTVVSGREAGKPVWNTRFADFAAELGFVPKVCRVRAPQTKGKVERLVKYVKDNFLPGRRFENLADLNRQALSWCRQADEKVHHTTGKIPLQELANERLKELPPQETLNKYRWETRIVTRDGLVSFDGVRYGVPWQYSGKEVRVRLCAGYLEIYYGDMLLTKHKAQYRSGNVVFLRGQYNGLAERNGVPMNFPCAIKQDDAVEVRELSVYDQLLGGVCHG